MFGTVKLGRNATKGKFTYNGREIEFDGEDLGGFENDFPTMVVNFGADNSSLFHTDNKRYIFSIT